MNRRSGQEGPVNHAKLRPPNLTAQDRQLVPQHEQLDVFHVQAAPAPDERAQHSPDDEVEEGESHADDPPSLLAPPPRYRYRRPSPDAAQTIEPADDLDERRLDQANSTIAWSSASRRVVACSTATERLLERKRERARTYGIATAKPAARCG
jgi:hypothetical protein